MQSIQTLTQFMFLYQGIETGIEILRKKKLFGEGISKSRRKLPLGNDSIAIYCVNL